MKIQLNKKYYVIVSRCPLAEINTGIFWVLDTPWFKYGDSRKEVDKVRKNHGPANKARGIIELPIYLKCLESKVLITTTSCGVRVGSAIARKQDIDFITNKHKKIGKKWAINILNKYLEEYSHYINKELWQVDLYDKEKGNELVSAYVVARSNSKFSKKYLLELTGFGQ